MIHEQDAKIKGLISDNGTLKNNIRELKQKANEAKQVYEQGMTMQKEVEMRIEMIRKCN